jgi:hypothetical protein
MSDKKEDKKEKKFAKTCAWCNDPKVYTNPNELLAHVAEKHPG